MRFAIAAEIAFVLLAGTAVYAFVSMARTSETRRACVPLCAMHPSYAGRNRTAPDFELRALDGRSVKLSQFAGKTVVLSFWTSACPPCIEEMPSLAHLAKVLAKRRDVVLLSVSTDTDGAAARSAIEAGLSAPAPFPVLLDPDSSVVGGKYGTRLFPETWFVDPRGIIRARFDGARDWSNPVVLDLIDSLARPPSCDIDIASGSSDREIEGICEETLSAG